MFSHSRACAAAALILFATASSAMADEAYFRTPSNNIHCAYDDYDGTGQVRCDISSFTPSFRKRPADCDLEWGDSFSVAAGSGKAAIVCHGDTVISPEAWTLDYGTAFDRGGIVCTSATAGLRCQNAGGHGFFISKAKQSVF